MVDQRRFNNTIRVRVQPEPPGCAAIFGAGCLLLVGYLLVLACIVGVIALVVKIVFGL